MRCRYHWFLNNNNNNNENKNNSNRKIAAAAAVLWCCCCCCVLLLLAAASLLVTCCGTHRNSIGTTTTTTPPSSDENIDSAHLFLRSSSSASASASAATAAASVRAPARAPATAPAPASATTEELSDTDMIIITYDSSSSSSSNSNNDDIDSDNESNKNNNNDHDHHDHSHTTLLYDSIDKHSSGSANYYKKISVGAGKDFWSRAQDETEHEKVRGWMYRFRAVVAAIAAEYRARGDREYIAVVADAYDVYAPDTEQSNALDVLRRKFLTAFGDSTKIVFSGQMYCCNPWNLRAAARADWDDHYGNNTTATGHGPATLYKHLNAGLYMGYATAVMKMADDMNVWDTVYERPEYFDDMMKQQQPQQEENGTGTATAVVLPRMKDIHVDDDEWQISAWYLEQQKRSMAASQSPFAVIDQQQVLFSVSATQRATYRESGFLISSVADYYDMIGRLPADFDASADLRRVTDCPYEYDAATMTWTNTVTGSHPVLFHFAGSHWLCACQVFREQGYVDMSDKFHKYCYDETAVTYWKDAVEQGIMSVSAAAADHDHHHRDRQLFVTTAAAGDGMTDNGNSHNDNNNVGDDSAASGAGARLLFRQPRTGPRIVPVSSLQYTP